MSDCPDLTAPIVDGKELRTKIDRFVSNETRVNVFVNAPEQEEFYTTNTDPTKDVETLPHFMNRLTNETDGIVERAEGAAEESEKILEEIRSMQGMATQLESYNFGDPVSYPDFKQELTNYALQQIPEWTEPANNTRVINLWDNHEWVYNRQTSEWIDIGPARDIDIGSANFPGLTPRAPIDWKSGYVLSLKEDGSLTFRKTDTFINLESDLDIYVDGTNGNDSTADGSNLLPFKTIMAALSYVSSTYFLAEYVVRINVASGNYVEQIILPSYYATSGIIIIRGAEDNSTTITNRIANALDEGHWFATVELNFPVKYSLQKLQLVASVRNDSVFNTGAMTCLNYGTIIISSCTFTSLTGGQGGFGVFVGNGGRVEFGTKEDLTPIHITVSGSTRPIGMVYAYGGHFNHICNVIVSGYGTTMRVDLGGTFIRASSPYNATWTGSVTGQRYRISGNSIASVVGGGVNFFPGTTAGIVSTGGQYF